jgi:hypothetical protein
MEEVVALLAGNFEADVTVALSRDNGLLTFAAHDDGSEFHRPPPQLCFFLVGEPFFLHETCSLLFACAVLVRRSQDQVKTRSQKLQQLLTGAESQLRAGINFLNPAFELTLRRPCFRS